MPPGDAMDLARIPRQRHYGQAACRQRHPSLARKQFQKRHHAAASIPADKLLIETDESTAGINETAARIAACRHISLPEVIALASENLQRAVAYTV